MNTFYNPHYFHFFDATTIAIMLPTFLLAFLVFAATLKKRYWALESRCKSITAFGVNEAQTDVSQVDDGRIAFVIKRLDLYLYCLILASAQAAFFVSQLNYDLLLGDSFHSLLVRCIPNMIWAVAISILDVLPLFALMQALRNKKGQFVSVESPGRPTRFMFSCMAFICLALWIVPLTQATFVAIGVLPGNLDLTKDLFRVGVAFSAVPLSVMGMMVAFTSNSSLSSSLACGRAQQRLHLQSLSPECLSSLSDERLHQIVDDARLTHNIEAAEIVSLHLLERAEAL
ncbi:MAG: hypothetical protein WCT03_08925 [Candidatus Obscuribacterales bacterium]|jgi:hypothetical protein